MQQCDIEIGQREIIARRIRDAVAAEREVCAKIADEVANDPHGSNPACSAGESIAAAIRARGAK